jgi:predicted Zn finger-like uncharacterized protein
MSLATSCPSCGTVFRVVQDQLKISEGWVRCGHCQEVFNALEGLFDLARRDTNTQSGAPDLATPATTNPNDPAWVETRPAMFSDGKVLRERQEALQNRPPPTPGSSKPPAATRVEISTRRAATWDPSVKEPERGLAPTQPATWRSTGDEVPRSFMVVDDPEVVGPDSRLAADDLPSDPPSTEDPAYPATTLEFRSEAFSAFATTRLHLDEGHPDVDLALDWPSAPAPLAPEPNPVLEAPPPQDVAQDMAQPPVRPPSITPTAAVPRETPPPATAVIDLEKTLDLSAVTFADESLLPEVPMAEPSVEEDHTPSMVKPAIKPHRHPATTSPSVETATPLPDFVRRADSQARWHRPGVRVALGLLALLLLGGMMAQVGHHWHDLIAARWPVARPLLAHACLQWQCQLQAPQQLDALVVDSTTLSRPPNTDGYVLGVTLHNRAGHAIAAPHIELSLTDLGGAVVVRRVLTPAEFRQANTLAAQSDASWSLAFSSTNQRIAGYTLAAFYP